MTGALSMGNNKITDVASPVNDGDAATKRYVDENAPILIFEESFENVDGTSLSAVPVGFDCSAFINTNKKIMVAEGVVTKVSRAINTSSQYYDTLKTKIKNNLVTITSFDKSQTVENITNKNRNIYSENCIISIFSNYGEPITGIKFGFLQLDTSYKVNYVDIKFTLDMVHGTITGTSGYFRVWLI